MELNIKDFDDLENYFKRKAQHVEELEQENTELTIENRGLKREMREIKDFCLQENRKLHQEIDRLRRLQVEYINQQLNRKKPSAETDDRVINMSNTDIIPQVFRKREQ